MWVRVPPRAPISGIFIRIMTYAGFWRRFVAILIDSVILTFVSFALHFASTRQSAGPSTFSLFMVRVAVVWLYYALFESSDKRATPGKMAMGLVVLDYAGQRLSFTRASVRYFSKMISGVLLGIGFFMVAFTERRQALHDMIAKTLVVRVGR